MRLFAGILLVCFVPAHGTGEWTDTFVVKGVHTWCLQVWLEYSKQHVNTQVVNNCSPLHLWGCHFNPLSCVCFFRLVFERGKKTVVLDHDHFCYMWPQACYFSVERLLKGRMGFPEVTPFNEEDNTIRTMLVCLPQRDACIDMQHDSLGVIIWVKFALTWGPIFILTLQSQDISVSIHIEARNLRITS